MSSNLCLRSSTLVFIALSLGCLRDLTIEETQSTGASTGVGEADTSRGDDGNLTEGADDDPWVPVGSSGTAFDDTGVACPADAKLCPDGSSVGRRGPDCEFAPCPGECPVEACGPAPGAPNFECPDGSVAGPECRSDGSGGCAWEWSECPSCPADAFMCPDGTWVSRVGPACAFEPCPSVECQIGRLLQPAGCPSDDGFPQLPAFGCYLPCELEGSPCDDGGVCTAVEVNPCPCGEGAQGCCAACAAVERVCLPASDACQALEGTFMSREQLECGRSPDGPVLCHWEITLDAGSFLWQYSDVGETGTYTCRDGVLTTERAIEAIYDAGSDVLVWDGVEYVR